MADLEACGEGRARQDGANGFNGDGNAATFR